MKLVYVEHLNSFYILPALYITYFDQKFSMELMWFNRGVSLVPKDINQ